MPKRKTHEEFIKDFNEKNPNAENIKILGRYQNRRTKIDCYCKIHEYNWSPTPGALESGQGCPLCAREKISQAVHKSFNWKVDNIKAKNPNCNIIFIEEIFANNEYKIRCKCPDCCHIWIARYSDLLRGRGCAVCAGKVYTHEQFVNKFNKSNIHYKTIELLDKYISCDTPMHCICKKCNTLFTETPTNLLLGRGCKKCNVKERANNNIVPFDVFENKFNDMPFADHVTFNKNDYVSSTKPMDFYCSIHKYSWNMKPYKILSSKYGCSKCAYDEQSKKLKKSHNDFVEELKQINPYITVLSEYKSSKDKVKVRCNLCGREWITQANNLLCGQGCANCNDGISYPNKFSYAFLRQLPIENIIHEYSPDWACGKRYDNYFEYNGKPYILEMDGKQHTIDMSNSNWESLEVTQENDKLKDRLAHFHNIEVIRINCIDTYRTNLKVEFENSKFGTLFDLSNIDWDKCEYYARSNLVKEVWDYYNKNTSSLAKDIAEQYDISVITTRRYLSRGNKLGICTYNRKEVCKRMKLNKIEQEV